jgi:hypothetical protein
MKGDRLVLYPLVQCWAQDTNMKNQTLRLKRLKTSLQKVMQQKQGADKVENIYRTLRFTLKEIYPKTVESIDRETLLELLHDAVYIDRLARRMRQGKQNTLKKKLQKPFKRL